MEVQKYISELLSEHDCVIIPGLGGFVGSYLPAQIHPVYHTFQPPSKKILFNVNLRQNDGLLANHIAQSERIPFNEAGERIRHFAEETIRALKTRKYLILPDIGKLYMGKEGNIQFDQDLRSNHLPESFGLQPFFSAPVSREGHLDKTEKKQTLRFDSKDLVKRAIPRPLKWAAILAVPIAVAILLSLAGYDSIKSGRWNTADILSSLSPFSKADKKEVPVESPPPEAWEETPEFPEETPRETQSFHGPVKGSPEASAPSGSTVDRETTTPVASPTAGIRYAVIVGAFGVENNAHRLVRQLNQQGIKAVIFDRSAGGLTRVAAGVFPTASEATRMMNSMKSQGFPGAWILEKQDLP